MPTETQEIQYDNLRVHLPAAEKLREVTRTYKEMNGVSATLSEMLIKVTDYYMAHVLKAAA